MEYKLPIGKSANKSWRVSEKKRAQNRLFKVELEKAIQKASASNINEVISKVDKAAKTHIISKNKAARMKSRLAKKFGTPSAKRGSAGSGETTKSPIKGKK